MRGRSAEGTGEGEREGAGEFAYVIAGGGDARYLHGFLLLLGGIGVGIDAEKEGEEGVDEAPPVLLGGCGEVRREAGTYGFQRLIVYALELYEIFKPAPRLDVVEIHGEEFEHTAAPREDVGEAGGEILRGEGGGICEGDEILRPGDVFPLEQGEEDLLLGAEIVVYGRAREGGLCAYRAQSDVFEGQSAIELRAGVYYLGFSRIREFLRSFGHINLRFCDIAGAWRSDDAALRGACRRRVQSPDTLSTISLYPYCPHLSTLGGHFDFSALRAAGSS